VTLKAAITTDRGERCAVTTGCTEIGEKHSNNRVHRDWEVHRDREVHSKNRVHRDRGSAQ